MPRPDLDLVDGTWRVTKRVKNPWGAVPLTAGGQALPQGAEAYMKRLASQHRQPDSVSRRHHYVPRTYLKRWSFDSKRVWALDTVTGLVKPLGLSDVCVQEDFYRVTGPDGLAHNRVELMFGVVDTELGRVQALFNQLEDPDTLEFDDLIALGMTVAVQRMRTAQERRLQLQYNLWMTAQSPKEYESMVSTAAKPHRLAGIHTQLLFEAMWEAADVVTTRQIEIWHDPEGRFMTTDAPIIVPLQGNRQPSLLAAPYIIWPISPHRVIALASDSIGEKAVILEATGKHRGLVRDGVEQGRERMIFASEDQRDRLPSKKKFRRRAQSRLRCSHYKPNGDYLPPPSCCVEWSVGLAAEPDVTLCSEGLHLPAPEMWKYP